uniref:SCAN box domain-containing protein n=1 Tax=Terrapene triunguis TaxID=2587831 RepID=A0A674J0G8_9SAUR
MQQMASQQQLLISQHREHQQQLLRDLAIQQQAAVLDYTGISPETYHQRLRKEQYPPGARPRAVAQRIRDHCWRWLKPEGLTGPQVAEMLVLEQFTQILSPGGRAWVLTLMEDYLSAEGTEATPRAAGSYGQRGGLGKGNPQRAGTWEPPSGARPVTPKLPSPESLPWGGGPSHGRGPQIGLPGSLGKRLAGLRGDSPEVPTAEPTNRWVEAPTSGAARTHAPG